MRRFFENEIALFSISIVNGRAREAEICEPAPEGRGRGAERGSRLYPPASPSGPLPTLGKRSPSEREHEFAEDNIRLMLIAGALSGPASNEIHDVQD